MKRAHRGMGGLHVQFLQDGARMVSGLLQSPEPLESMVDALHPGREAEMRGTVLGRNTEDCKREGNKHGSRSSARKRTAAT